MSRGNIDNNNRVNMQLIVLLIFSIVALTESFHIPYLTSSKNDVEITKPNSKLQPKTKDRLDEENKMPVKKDEESPPLEHLAVKAYGEPGEKWKVVGYSPTTGYPIIDISGLGSSSSKTNTKTGESSGNLKVNMKTDNTEMALNSSKTEQVIKNDTSKPRPLSYSEMKGIKKKPLNPDTLSSTIPPENKYYKITRMVEPSGGRPDPQADLRVRALHSKLHRTHSKRDLTVRSILYPHLNPPKYRVMSRARKIEEFLNFQRRLRSRGKYDVRKLDVEKLLDIVISDAALLTFKYIRDLPSLPLIYECKMGLLQPLSLILGAYQAIEKKLGKPVTGEKSIRLTGLRLLMKQLFKWVFNIYPPPKTVLGPASQAEHHVTMFQNDLPHWSDKECEGVMDRKDWETFNFNYNYLINLGKRGTIVKPSKTTIGNTITKKLDSTVNRKLIDQDTTDDLE